MEQNSEFCVNCGSARGLNVLRDERILQRIRQWIAPRLVENHDVVCKMCWNEANNTISNVSNNKKTCALCNIALPVRARSHQVIALRTDTQHRVNIKNFILERLKQLQIHASHFICHPCWQRCDRAVKHLSPPSISISISTSVNELKCANCGINIIRMGKHSLKDENILSLIQQQTAPRVVTATDYICDACHIIFSNETSTSQRSVQSLGHQNICVQCGRSLARVRSCTVQDSDRICHRCFQRVQTSADIMLCAPVSDSVVQQTERITLPNYTRAPDTHARCIFPLCQSTTQQMVPFVIRVRLLSDLKYYIPPNCRICSSHLESQSWSDLLEVENVHNSFTAKYIEDFCELLRNDKITIDFNNIHLMDDHLVWYWLGHTKEQFQELLAELPEFKNKKKALGAYLIKLRTGDSDDRIASLLHMGRSTLNRLVAKAREVLAEHNIED